MEDSYLINENLVWDGHRGEEMREARGGTSGDGGRRGDRGHKAEERTNEVSQVVSLRISENRE